MVDIKDLSNRDLADLIAYRKSQISVLKKMTHDLIEEKGKMACRDEQNSNTHVIYELKDFAGFHILDSSGESMFGGSTLTIQSSGPDPKTYLIISNDEVRYFLDSDDWYYSLEPDDWFGRFRTAYENRDKHFKIIDDVETAETKKKEDAIAYAKEREKLVKEARDLKLID